MENKLTDEAVNSTVKSLKWVCNQIPKDLGDSNEERMLKCIQLYCQQGIAVIERLQSEIKRLTEENGQLKGYNSGLEYENAELQKQVNALTEQLKKLKLAHTSLCDECADYCPRVPQAVKDTAKEILQELWDETEPLNESHKWVRLRIKNIASRKGVEVE